MYGIRYKDKKKTEENDYAALFFRFSSVFGNSDPIAAHSLRDQFTKVSEADLIDSLLPMIDVSVVTLVSSLPFTVTFGLLSSPT